jgi:hypothetical protein
MIHLVTAATPGYPWAKPYWDSVLKHVMPDNPGPTVWTEPDPKAEFQRIFPMFLETTPGYQSRLALAKPPYPSRWFTARLPENRTKCLQHGEFLQYLIPLTARDVVIFTDADMLMQRAFSQDELELFCSLGADEVLLGPNGDTADTLHDEAQLLLAHDDANVEQRARATDLLRTALPEWWDMPARNTGVVICQLQTYRRLYDLTRAVLPVCEAAFAHYAALQFAICYAVGRWLRGHVLSRSIHTHGHFGVPAGATWDAEGNVCREGQRCVFRHCLNLTPEKGPKP